MRFYILYIVCFVAFVGVHYMEGLPPVGGFSMAQLWKIPILMYLLFICMTSRRKYAFEKSAYYYSMNRFYVRLLLRILFLLLYLHQNNFP